jgi:hypothetical protein
MADTMRAWAVDRPGRISSGPLLRLERPMPDPGPDGLRVRVSVRAVCRTDLHLPEGDLPPRRWLAVPGHEVQAGGADGHHRGLRDVLALGVEEPFRLNLNITQGSGRRTPLVSEAVLFVALDEPHRA